MPTNHIKGLKDLHKCIVKGEMFIKTDGAVGQMKVQSVLCSLPETEIRPAV